MATFIEYFLLGYAFGIAAVVLTIMYGFHILVIILKFISHIVSGKNYDHVRKETITSEEAIKILKEARTQDKRSLREQGLEGMTGSTSLNTPLKLTSSCTLTWYEEGSGCCGMPVECRLSLSGGVVSVSELLPTRKGLAVVEDVPHQGKPHESGSNHHKANVFAEHLKGKMDVMRLSVKELKQFGKVSSSSNNNASNTYASTNDGATDKIPDNVSVAASQSGGKSQNAQPYSGSGPSLTTSNMNNNFSGATFSGGAKVNNSSNIPAVFHGKVLCISSSDDRPLFAAGKLNDVLENSMSEGVDTIDDIERNLGLNSRANMATWTCMIVKFNSLRDQERWLTLLRCLDEAEAWRQFAKNIPNPDTFNLFASRFLFQNFSGDGFVKLLVGAIRKKLKKVSLTKFPRDLEGDILLDDFIMGNALPWISEVSDATVSTNGEFGFDFNIQYKGGEEAFVLYFRLALSYRGIRIPHVIFSVKLLELEGTAHISIGPPPSTKFWIGGHKLPVMRLEVQQGGASGKGLLHHILSSLPDLSGILTNLIKLYLFSDMILPYMDDFPLPSVEAAPKVKVEKKSRTFDRHRAAAISGARSASRNRREAEEQRAKEEESSEYRFPPYLQGSGQNSGGPDVDLLNFAPVKEKDSADAATGRNSDLESTSMSMSTGTRAAGVPASSGRRTVKASKYELKAKGENMASGPVARSKKDPTK